MLGGVVMAVLTIVAFCRFKKISILRFFDAAAPSLALGLALSRIGCFFNGCCFGKPGSLPWCVAFPDNSPAGAFLPDQRLHPTQIYSSLFRFSDTRRDSMGGSKETTGRDAGRGVFLYSTVSSVS